MRYFIIREVKDSLFFRQRYIEHNFIGAKLNAIGARDLNFKRVSKLPFVLQINRFLRFARNDDLAVTPPISNRYR